MYAAINKCRSGMPLNVIGNVIHDVAASYGFRPVKNVLGHGIGTAFHMYPKVKVNILCLFFSQKRRNVIFFLMNF